MPPRRWGDNPDPEDELDALLADEEAIANEQAQQLAREHAEIAAMSQRAEQSRDASDALFFGDEPEHQPSAVVMQQDSPEEHHTLKSEPPPNRRRQTPPPGPSTSAAHLYAASAARANIPKYIPAEPIFAVTTNGTPVTIPRRRRTRGWQPKPVSFADYGDAELLEQPLHQIMERIERGRETQPVRKIARGDTGPMWVDKYRPQSFSELLGDERVHRNSLRWLKEWDPCVFHRDPPRQRAPRDENTPPPDPYGRPSELVLLISGPPGLGKTTLAHVIAKQAGYRVYELNASDARTAADVDERIRMALESDSLRGGGRPTLVVIDEIDGSTGGDGSTDTFVRALVRLIERGRGAPERRFRGHMAPDPQVGRSRRKAAKPLLRPIICICNDLYAPSLRTLRPLARILRYNKSPSALVSRRLSEVCSQEQLRCDTRSLMLLCDLTNGDIRSCLHALQMIHCANGEVNERTVADAAIGIKDSAVSMNSLWEQLFRGVNTRSAAYVKGRAQRAKGGQNVGQKRDALQALLHEIISYGEYDRLALACFEHYLHLRVPDDGWWRYVHIHDWLHFCQSISHRTWSGSGVATHELLGYQPYSFLSWHLLFSNITNPLPEQLSRTDYDVRLY